jgi:hypothetical protein
MAFLLFTYEANCFSEKQPFQHLDSITDMNIVDTNWHIVIVATFTSLANKIKLATLRMCDGAATHRNPLCFRSDILFTTYTSLITVHFEGMKII